MQHHRPVTARADGLDRVQEVVVLACAAPSASAPEPCGACLAPWRARKCGGAWRLASHEPKRWSTVKPALGQVHGSSSSTSG
eukprot:5634947-Pyramimonas_sp.AAC.1